jgi:hypothetical protein
MDQEGWLEAWTELDGQGFRFEIVNERGSEQVRNRVLRAVLKREQEVIASGEGARSALTAANYDFGEADVQETGVQYVPLKPKRKDMLLVDGYMVLSPDGRELLRVGWQEPVLLDEPGEHHPPLRTPGRRPRADRDRIGRQSKVRRYVATGRPLPVRVDQRPAEWTGCAADDGIWAK